GAGQYVAMGSAGFGRIGGGHEALATDTAARCLGGRAAERVGAALGLGADWAAGHQQRQELTGLAGHRLAVGPLEVNSDGIRSFLGKGNDGQRQ
nr:hypothetical protein [Tanacetum cinerariifolium]